MNTEYTPSDTDEQILDVLDAQPCGRANPYLIRDETGLSKQRVSNSLRQLVAAGWVEKVTRGLYDLVGDPREQGDRADEPDESTDAVDVADALAGWEPDTDANAQAAIEETANVVAWLAANPGRHKRAAIVEACLPDGVNDEHWWAGQVRPGLQQLAEIGLVEYRPNYPDYQWSE